MNNLLKTDNEDYVIAIDTDSVVGDTLIYVNGKQIKIEDYFTQSRGEYMKNDDFNSDWVKRVDNGDTTYSVSSVGALRTNPIKYVMKHKVRKRMFRINVDGKSVTVTADHSIIVERENQIMSVKPGDIKSGDVLLTVKGD